VGSIPAVPSRPASDLHDLAFFAPPDLIYLTDRLVGQFLQPILGALDLVLGDVLFLLRLPQVVDRIAATVSDGHAGFLNALVNLLHEVTAALFVQGRQAEADDRAVAVRRQAEI
jgi:hypothetical protein